MTSETNTPETIADDDLDGVQGAGSKLARSKGIVLSSEGREPGKVILSSETEEPTFRKG